MLNECYEYDQYISDPSPEYESFYGQRLQKRLLIKDGLTGLSRPLCIVARGKLFNDNLYGKIGKDLIEDVKSYLNSWFSASDGWFLSYVKTILKENMSGQVKKKSIEYNKPSFSMGPDFPEHDLNEVHYDRIIAEALSRGELSQYYLVADCAEEAEKAACYDTKADVYEKYVFENIISRTANKDVSLISENKNDKARYQYRSTVLMLLAVYLLNRNEYSQNKALFSVADFSNWRAKKNESARRTVYYRNGKQLILTESALKNKKGPQKIVIQDTEWLSKCRWKILKKEELFGILQKNRNTLFYRDYYYGPCKADHQDFVFPDNKKDIGLIKRSFNTSKNETLFENNTFYLNELDFWREKGLLAD